MRKKLRITFLTVLFIFLIAILFMRYINNPLRNLSTSDVQMIKKLMITYQLVDDLYIKDVSREKLLDGALNGMLTSLKDPYSTYMDNKDTKDFNDEISSKLEGIGTEVTFNNNQIMVVSTIKNSPAQKAGIKANDIITHVNNKDISDLSLTEATSLIKGKKGTSVLLTIKRAGVIDPIKISVVRDTIKLETVHHKLLHQNNKTLGYIEISSFSFDTAKEFKKHLSILESKKIDGLIIDLRDNPGGSLETVEEIASLFVTSDKTIVQMVDKSGKKEVFHSKLKQKKPYKIDLLINGQSASASEILSAAMNEAEGYPLVGEKSFGKGIAQSLLDLKDGSQIKLTTQKWLTPNGNWIHKKGIKPTFEVKQPSYFTTSPILIKKPLKFDVVDTQVKNAQILLKVIGYDSHRNDGYFSSDTKVAVENFQKSTNLKVTGILDSVTADLINQKVREKIEDTNNDFQLKEAIEILTK